MAFSPKLIGSSRSSLCFQASLDMIELILSGLPLHSHCQKLLLSMAVTHVFVWEGWQSLDLIFKIGLCHGLMILSYQ